MKLETISLIITFIVSIILGIIIIPILRKLKVGQIERDDGPKSHLKKQGTPTMGGVIIALTIFIVCMGLYVKYSVSEANVAKNILPLLFVRETNIFGSLTPRKT